LKWSGAAPGRIEVPLCVRLGLADEERQKNDVAQSQHQTLAHFRLQFERIISKIRSSKLSKPDLKRVSLSHISSARYFAQP
jgi:hypothetical protein